jgi:cell division protein FtsB
VSSRSRLITIIIILALTAYAGISLYNFWGDHVELLDSLHESRREAAELQQKIDDLKYMLANIDDPDVMRRIAEEVLGLVSPDELVITDGSGVQWDD